MNPAVLRGCIWSRLAQNQGCCRAPSSFHLSWIPIIASFLSRRLFAHRWVCLGGKAQASFGTASGVLTEEPWLCWCLQGVSCHASSERCSCPLRAGRRDFISFCLVTSGEESVFLKQEFLLKTQWPVHVRTSPGAEVWFPLQCLVSFCCPLLLTTVSGFVVHLSPCWGRVLGEVV